MKRIILVSIVLVAMILVIVLVLSKEAPNDSTPWADDAAHGRPLDAMPPQGREDGTEAGAPPQEQETQKPVEAQGTGATVPVHGRVMYANQKPVPHAKIEYTDLVNPLKIARSGRAYLPSGRIRCTKADKKGEFRVRGLAPGRYAFQAYDETDAAYVHELLTEGEDVHEVKIVLPSKGTLSGYVCDESRSPLEGVKVWVWFGKVIKPSSGIVVKTEETLYSARDGTYRVENVPPNKIRVLLSKDGYVTENFMDRQVTEGETLQLNTTMRRGATIMGKIHVNPAFLPDPAGGNQLDKYVSVGLIKLDREGSCLVARKLKPTPTAPDGSYRIPVTSFQMETILFVRARGHRPRWITLSISEGETKSFDVTLTEPGGRFSGKIKLRQGSDVKEIGILLYHSVREDETAFPISITVGKDGAFLVDYLDYVKYEATFSFDYPDFKFRGFEHVFKPHAEGLVFKEPDDKVEPDEEDPEGDEEED